MLSALEELMRHHPGSHFGSSERPQSDLAAFEELESRHLCPRHEYETDRREPAWMLGEVVAAAAMLVVSGSMTQGCRRPSYTETRGAGKPGSANAPTAIATSSGSALNVQ